MNDWAVESQQKLENANLKPYGRNMVPKKFTTIILTSHTMFAH